MTCSRSQLRPGRVPYLTAESQGLRVSHFPAKKGNSASNYSPPKERKAHLLSPTK